MKSVKSEIEAAIAITLGAIPGALSRYYISIYFAQWFGAFPYGTLFVNLTGAFVMGGFTAYVLTQAIEVPNLRLLVATGFLGSYTTFSTYALDTVNLMQTESGGWALLYWLGSAVCGVAGLKLGSVLGQKLL